nr:unnamed protein product [Digitaria exilis]
MSRHNTRNKSKRPRQDESSSPSAAVFKKIHSDGNISKSDIRQLYMVWKPHCQGCHGNTKDSPNCFCGLIPTSNGVRKTGLWQKMQEIVRSLGPNPSRDLRDSNETPAGLTNLGATCYANSILQCLYMNTSFRSGIFSLELDVLKKHPVLDQLAQLFAQLHSSKMAFIDSAPFIKALELDNGVQQDSHEFLTLFLSLLEQSLSHSKVPGARTIVQHLFCGSVSHVTSSIDNGPIQCEHGKVPASKVTSMKRLSSVAWQKLLSKYGGGPALSSDDCCMECLKDGAKNAVSADVYRERKASLKTIAEAALAGSCPDGPSYFISRTWLTHWLRRKNADITSDADNGPTSALRCCHGDLLPEHAPGAKRVAVPESLWLFLYQTINEKKADDIMTFPSDCRSCEICNQELSDVASVEGNLRSVKLQQRQNHEKLISGKSLALHPGQKYYLVPSSWLSEWRAYITATGKNISLLPEPQSLEAIVNSLLCEKHSRLLQRPLDLVCKRGSITQKTSNNDGLTMIPEYDWKLFSEEWNATPDKGISAEIAFSKSSQDKLSGSSEANPIMDGDLDQSLDDANDDLGDREPYVITDPEIVKENQKLHKGSAEIEDDFATLADKSIFPGDVLWVRDSEIYENRDIADEISEQKTDVQQAEEGFRGTLLTSSVSAQLCQDIAFSE